MKNTKMKKIYYNLTKHLTITNILVSLVGLFIGFIFKYSGLPLQILQYFLDNPSDNHIYLFSGLVAIISRLVIKGVVEDFMHELFPEYMAMDIGRLLNPQSPPPPTPPPAPLPQRSANNMEIGNPRSSKITAWVAENYQGDGFRVVSGVIYIDNPYNIISFFNREGRPDSSLLNKQYGACLHRALTYHSQYMNTTMLPPPLLDGCANAWFNQFMIHSFPERNFNQYNNSHGVRNALKKFIK